MNKQEAFSRLEFIRKEYMPIRQLQEFIEKEKKDFEERMQFLHWILNCMEDEYQRKIAILRGEGEI